ncbi:tape measure protein [Enterobacter hormaechei subsp. xiangfangensis]|uniref:tape measure protein n=1 Tax=Enterobacter hormaechei TaxID=158836 RepID=UPI0028740C53|nr:tape measure protein [Enterobacter hormaechei]MDR9923120.1 tape measure protein [Enterobacter hormaechei subsp. xiangfangensis]MDS0007750.1 tape measure protein [Enterobacter hormaechei subsp. xiangfangensis]MDS0050530.1 tape measure protein [Enterobacter hormaechei subsp. xiangfangensis]
MVIRELLIKLGLTGTEDASNGLDDLDGSVNDTIASFNTLGSILGVIFGGITLSKIAQTADEMQSLQARIGLLPQTLGESADDFDTVASRASQARSGISAYASFYIRAANATQDFMKSQEDVLKLTDAVSISLAAGGATAEEQGQAFFQLGQAIGSPAVQMEEMNTVIDVAPQLFRALQDAIPGADGNLKKFIGTGNVTGKMLAEGLLKVLPQFTGQFEQMPMTIGQALVLVNNRWDVFINRMNRSSGAVTWVAKTFLWMADQVEFALDIVIDALGGAENAVKLLGVALGAAGLVGSVYLLSAAFTALTSPVFLVIAALAALFLVGEDINSWLNGNKSLLGDMIGPVSEYTDSINSLKVALTDMKDMAVWALNVLNSLANFFNSSQDKVQEWGDQLGTTKFAPWLKEKAGWLVEDLGKWASWGNAQTNGAFDIPRMWSDTLAGVRGFNQDAKGGNTLLPSYQSLSLPPPSTAAGPKIDVNIGNISVPAGTSDEQAKFLQDSAKSAFSDYGWNALGNTLNFNTGG